MFIFWKTHKDLNRLWFCFKLINLFDRLRKNFISFLYIFVIIIINIIWIFVGSYIWSDITPCSINISMRGIILPLFCNDRLLFLNILIPSLTYLSITEKIVQDFWIEFTESLTILAILWISSNCINNLQQWIIVLVA